jgi:hypothetical protein
LNTKLIEGGGAAINTRIGGGLVRDLVTLSMAHPPMLGSDAIAQFDRVADVR